MNSWIDDVRSRGVAEVAEAFGLKADKRRRTVSPCPACKAERRHPKRRDRRGALGLTHDGQGFRCFECDAHGSAVDLAGFVLHGTKPARGNRAAWASIHEESAARGLCEFDAGNRRLRMPQERRKPRDPIMNTPPPIATVTSTPATRRPPAPEVLALWKRCASVVEDAEVRAWIEGRGLDPAHIVDRDLARALPMDGPLPGWCRYMGRSWRESSHRVIVPLYAAGGQLESLHARALAPATEKDKAASPAGAEVRGLVMADALAVEVLRGAPPAGWPRQVVVSEGVPDFLTWATHYGDAAEDAPALIGVISGSWSLELAATIPDGSRVIVRTHHDKAGDKYAETIRASVARRCKVLRSQIPENVDT